MRLLEIKPGDVVVIGGFDDIPEHQFQVEEVFEDLVTGTVLTGPFAGEYGEPDIEMIVEIISQETTTDSRV
jgi:hypothetical protein